MEDLYWNDDVNWHLKTQNNLSSCIGFPLVSSRATSKSKFYIQLHSSHCYWQTRFVVSQKLLTDDFFFQFMVIWGNYFWSLFPTADIKTPAKTGANFGCIRWWAPFPHHHQLLMSIAYQCTEVSRAPLIYFQQNKFPKFWTTKWSKERTWLHSFGRWCCWSYAI